MSNPVNVDIEVLPSTGGEVYSIVDRAIEVIQASGLKYEVGPLGTTVEGDLDSCMEVAKAPIAPALSNGVERVVTDHKGRRGHSSGLTIEGLVAKFREES